MIGLFVTAALLVIAGTGLALLGLSAGRRNGQFNARALSTEGTVVGSREHYSTSGSIHRRIYLPLVSYTTAAGQTLQATAPGSPEPLAAGTRVPLLYDPKAPGEVSFTGRRGGAGMAKAIGIMGIVLALAGIGTALLAIAA